MDKKEKRRKLLMLNHLVNTGGDSKQIQALRAELGMGEEADIKEAVADKELEEIAKTYVRLRAFGLLDNEIAFALRVGINKVKKAQELLTDEGVEEAVKKYAKHDTVQRFHRLRTRPQRPRNMRQLP